MRIEDYGVDVAHVFGGGMYIKSYTIPANLCVVQHIHKHDHISILAKGSVIVEIEGEREKIEAPRMFLIKAGVHHGIRALTDSLWYCCHNVDAALDSVEAIEKEIATEPTVAMGEILQGLQAA